MKNTFFLLIVLINLTGCNQRIIHYLNDSSPLASYNTYTVTKLSNSEKSLNATGQEILRTIENEISGQMEKRGYQSGMNADVIIRYEVISEQQSTAPSNQSRYQSYYNPFPTNMSRTILQSALLVEMYDMKTKDLIWQASVDMDKYTKSTEKAVIISSSVESIFSTYLYRAGSDVPDDSLKSKE